MNWIYEAPGENINREEYLLGRKVDKYVDPSLQAAEREKHLLATTPGALFAGASVNATVDLENKIREDPLFEIKKREQEAKKRLANNPVKLKQLRALVEEVKGAGGKKKKKRKHKSSDSEDDTVHIKSKSKSRQQSSKQHQERSGTGVGHRTRHHSRSPSDRHHRPTSRHGDRSRSPSGDNRQHRAINHHDRSRSPRDYNRQHRPAGYHKDRQDRKSHYDTDYKHRHDNRAVSKRLTQEELEQKRREMMSNAEWHAEQREERVRKHRIEEEQEERERQERAGKQEEFVDPLMAESLADAAAGTLSDRIHRKIGSVQRTRAALEKSFTRK